MRTLLVCLALVVCCAACPVQSAWAKKPDNPGGGASHNESHKNQGNPGGRDKADRDTPGNHDKGDRGNQGGRGYDKDNAGDKTAEHLLRAGITALEARRWAMGERLTGLQTLPPGIRKNLARGKPLPPGIAKKMVPPGLLGRLPVYPGYEWRMLGTDLVLVYLAQELVADILLDVFK